ncbi:MAG TPA: dicarboxylate/amino acid:cation symporter [Cellvibrionaceae bacterium]|nr:dicarboxylate/amino acid:cation symporter [Cellvibrionaceae bacterium]HMW70568.1 dicarboxylate/amino acid:cation symporter [Cellvibrionaceae bacterium]HNG60582.1 dicarboxylate/amino acid:cation symporter [Cellvibrionaceae bacterium]
MKLHWQILIAIGLAFITGLLLPKDSQVLGVSLYSLLGFFGAAFLQGLKMLVIPLVISSVICGVAGIGSNRLGRMGWLTAATFIGFTASAVLVGLLMVNLFSPGTHNGKPASDLLNLVDTQQVAAQVAKVAERDGGDLAGVFLRMIPSNIVAAASDDGQMLGVIMFSLLFGYFLLQSAEPGRSAQLSFWRGLNDTMMRMTLFVMKFAPIGVYGLITQTVMNTGLKSLSVMGVFFITVAAGLILHCFGTLALYLKVFGRVNPLKHYKAMFPAMLTAFSTASSNASLPVNIKCLEENAKVSHKTTSFVLPLGASLNMDGTALYECVAVIFIAQAYGVDLTHSQQVMVVLMALLTSFGIAGIPAASLVAISVILGSLGLPIEAIALLMVTDRILDMMRTAVNVFSDSCCAVVVARVEGEKGVLVD